MNKLLLITALMSSLAMAYQKNSPSPGLNSAAVSALGQPEYREELVDLADRYVQVELTSAQIRTLNTTPVLVVTSPGAGKALVPHAVYATLDFRSIAHVTNSDKTLDLEYGGSRTGEKVASLPTAFVEATADKAGLAYVSGAVAPLENTALYAHIDTGNPSTGDSSILLRIYYKVVPYLLD